MKEQKKIIELPFTDLYIKLDDEEDSDYKTPARYRPDYVKLKNLNVKDIKIGNYSVPDEYSEDLENIKNKIREEARDEGAISYLNLRMRFVKFIADSENWAALRAVPLDIPSFEALKMNAGLVNIMKDWSRKKGLIVVGGSTGAGKTTTCISLIKDFLETRGGFAYTIEDPVEYQLQGVVGERGFCLQVEVSDDKSFLEASKKAMRSRPDYILFGELRTPRAAEYLLKAATSGHLVITTIHAGDCADIVSSLMQLASASDLGEMGAKKIIADKLIAVMHQQLSAVGPLINMIQLPVDRQNDVVYNAISKGELANLNKNAQPYKPTNYKNINL